jgi:hypothetical protein
MSYLLMFLNHFWRHKTVIRFLYFDLTGFIKRARKFSRHFFEMDEDEKGAYIVCYKNELGHKQLLLIVFGIRNYRLPISFLSIQQSNILLFYAVKKTGYGNGDIFFFSSSGSRHSENLKRILGTLEGKVAAQNFPKFPKILKVFQSIIFFKMFSI